MAAKVRALEVEIAGWWQWWAWQCGHVKQSAKVPVAEVVIEAVEAPVQQPQQQQQVQLPETSKFREVLNEKQVEVGDEIVEVCPEAEEMFFDGCLDDMRWDVELEDANQEEHEEDDLKEHEEDAVNEGGECQTLQDAVQVYGPLENWELLWAMRVEKALLQDTDVDLNTLEKADVVFVQLGNLMIQTLHAYGGSRLPRVRVAQAAVGAMGPEMTYISRGDCFEEGEEQHWCKSYVLMLCGEAARDLGLEMKAG